MDFGPVRVQNPFFRTLTYCFGLYHLSSPACASLPACSGVVVPLITPALKRHSSFSRFGSPRERIWYELRMVDLHSPRQLRNTLASGSFTVILWLERVKKPGKALLYSSANSGVVIHSRNL